jgi:DNA-binding MarR family transcriptional regulator
LTRPSHDLYRLYPWESSQPRSIVLWPCPRSSWDHWQHLAILLTLEFCGPQVQAHLNDQLGIDKTTMVELLNLLEQQGRVERQQHPHDRRAHLVHITPEGTEAIRQAKEIDQKTAEQFLSVLTPPEQQYLLYVLKRLGRNEQTSKELKHV